MRSPLLLSALVLSALYAACSGDAATDPAGGDAGKEDVAVVDPHSDQGINVTGVGAGTGAATGLPCDVQQIIENTCLGCHGGTGTTSVKLLTYEDLLKPSASDPTKTLAQVSLARMQSTTNPMPPKPAEPPTAAEIAVFDAWVKAGSQKGAACTDPPGGGDAGPTADAGPDAGSIYSTPLVCTSKVTWDKGNTASPEMRPGGTCITCHSMRGGPRYSIAGTVYPSAHEPNDCNGSTGAGLTVVVTDKNGKVTTLPVNKVGNFFTRAQIVAPFRVKVTNGAKERAMVGSLTAGDCNTCHTAAGANGAPGRIIAP